ncbi:MAG: IS200/IS605 family transposase [Candidatus Pseudobacter hemicellulosilyticus]|uniref:IS200/IS605 family transposase n=1 Tax=Candidatus Pseudobacter hemicellulosilyticus TaxID=3121375 RepID=A0AAJ5WR82_9BACT|nr:MAG: IS200/IS605 family transposase [Pseudobacter sp.]
MLANANKVYLFVHIIWTVKDRQPLLSKPIRMVLFTHLQKHSEAKGIKILSVNGVEDHVHCLVQLHPTQNLSQLVKTLKADAEQWVNDTRLLSTMLEWENGFAAYSVSPSSYKQVADFIQKQEEHHKTKTLESELEVFDKVQL